MEISVIKIGGNVIDHPEKCKEFLRSFAEFPGYKILVHGGGVLASRIGKSLGIEPKMVNGRRITDEKTLEVVTMVYAGLINKQLVAQLQAYGQNAIGMTGADGNIIRSIKRPVKDIDYGYAGDVVEINSSLLANLVEQQLAPVICAITHDRNGLLLNTNADTIASTLATSLATQHTINLYYCFDRAGVLMDVNDERSRIPLIDEDIYEDLKKSEIIHSGMLPKLENAFAALNQGVSNVWMGLPERLLQAATGENSGTIIRSKKHQLR